MFQINGTVINIDDYYITYDYDGLDTLDFDISTSHPCYTLITERALITDSTNTYLITKIDGNSAKYVHVTAEVDRRAFQAVFYENYDNGSKKLTEAVSAFLPAGWTFVNNGNTTSYRTLRLEYGTALDLLNNCAVLYKVRFRFNALTKTLTAVNPGGYTKGAAFVTEELNLRSLQYYGDASEYITRLEVRGKDGLTFASINDGKSYVENYTYSNDIIYGYWKDERYTVKEELLQDATEKLAELAKPKRSYECDVVDLKSIDPDKYTAFDLSLFQKIALKDVSRETEYEYQVVKVRSYPHYPEKNVINLSTEPPKLTTKLQEIETEVAEFDEKIEESQSWLTDSDGGKIYFIRDNDGNITSQILKCGDSENPPVWVFNKNGIGYSASGTSGTPIIAMKADGTFVADFIQTGKIAGWQIGDHVLSTTNGGGVTLDSGTGVIDVGNMHIAGNPDDNPLGCPVLTSVDGNGDILVSAASAVAFGYPTFQNGNIIGHTITAYIYPNYNGYSKIQTDYLTISQSAGRQALANELVQDIINEMRNRGINI